MNNTEIMEYAYTAAVAKYDIPVIEAIGIRLKIDYAKDLPIKVRVAAIRKAIKTGDAAKYTHYKFKDFEKHLDITNLARDAIRSQLDISIIAELMQLGGNIDKVKNIGMNYAIKNNDPNRFLWFLGQGADINIIKREYLSKELDDIFTKFTGLSKVEIKISKNVTKDNKSILLHINKEFNPGDVTLTLLKQNGYVTELEPDVIEVLISNDFTKAVIEYCFNKPKEVNIKAMQRSIYHGNLNVVEELLSKITLNKKEYTKLVLYAFKNGPSYVLEYLLQNIDLIDKGSLLNIKKYGNLDNIILHGQKILGVLDGLDIYPTIKIDHVFNPWYMEEHDSLLDYQFDENGEFITDDDLDNIELISPDTDVQEELLQNEQSSIISKVLSKLDEREQTVIQLRFGLYSNDDEDPGTLDHVGKVLNITRERVRQIENTAIKTLKHPKISRELKDYLNY